MDADEVAAAGAGLGPVPGIARAVVLLQGPGTGRGTEPEAVLRVGAARRGRRHQHRVAGDLRVERRGGDARHRAGSREGRAGVVRTDRDAEVSAVVVREGRDVVVAEVALPRHHGRRVGDPVALEVRIRCLTSVRLPKQHGDDAGRGEVGGMREEVLDAVVLIVTVRVVHRLVVLVADRHLPPDERPTGVGVQATHEDEPAREVGEQHVVPVPPVVVGERAVRTGVVVGDVVEHQVPRCDAGRIADDSGLVQEGGDLVRLGVRINGRALVASDVHAAAPRAGVDGQESVGRVFVAQLEKGPAHPLHGVGQAREVGVAGAGDHGQDGRRVRALVFHEAPEVRLDVHDDLSGVRADLLHQDRKVGPVPLHRA